MNEEYIRYAQSREPQRTSVLGRYVQIQTFDKNNYGLNNNKSKIGP